MNTKELSLSQTEVHKLLASAVETLPCCIYTLNAAMIPKAPGQPWG